MKPEEKSWELIKSIEAEGVMLSDEQRMNVDILLARALREQDRDTRHACAELFSDNSCSDQYYEDFVHSHIMNCRGGTE